MAFFSIPARIRLLAAAAVLVFAVFAWLSCRRSTLLVRAFIITTALLIFGCLTVWLLHNRLNKPAVARNTRYIDVETGKEALYDGKRVMLIVPHEDDDLNVLGGVLEEYLRHGSELFVVFMTNGDSSCDGEIRISEALALYQYLGVPEDHLFFLGYGDQMKTEDIHIYNAAPDVVITSSAGKSATYATNVHPAFRSNHAYTKSNLMQDMKDVVLEVRPEIIYCVDYDMHWDHKACSLIFEHVMGEILKDVPDYTPEVLKGFAYSTAWDADIDFFEVNMKSTQNMYFSRYGQEPAIYRWNERARMPVLPGILARSLPGSELYTELSFYESQRATDRAASVINGDKVFWKRATDSLCRTATVSASSGNAEKLTDFMLLDTDNLWNLKHMPVDGAWIPDEADSKKTARMEFEYPEDIYEVVLYDNPSEEDNILNAEILFDDGSSFETGPLDPSGAASRFYPDVKQVQNFRIIVLEAEGTRAGITEIEAFSKPNPKDPTFLKIMDPKEDFAYDYWTDREGKAFFVLYSDGLIPGLNTDEYEILCEGNGCRAEIEDGVLVVRCGESVNCILTVTLKTSGLSDTVLVRNPSGAERVLTSYHQRLEMFFLENYKQLAVGKILETMRNAAV